MNTYDAIIENSKDIDWSNADISSSTSLQFSVPVDHKRHRDIKKYYFRIDHLDKYSFQEGSLILVDRELKDYIPLTIKGRIEYLEAIEGKLKTVKEADILIESWKDLGFQKVVAIGGGLMGNVGAYVAEQLHTDLVLVPTTIIAMCDASIGGKVRMNYVEGDRFLKHYYKEFYEPSEIIADPKFLETISNEWVSIGLAEIIKHALYQSPRLKDYLISDSFDPFQDKSSLLRAIVWTVDLKRVCLEIDPDDQDGGSRKILRAAHDLSDKIEEKAGFKISHGRAVEEAMVEDLKDDPRYQDLIKIYTKLSIPYKK
jgi:3-dehydroquinate synthetase